MTLYFRELFMSFFKKAMSTSMVFVLTSSSYCCTKGYTSDELKDLAIRLLCNNFDNFHLNPRSYRRVMNETSDIDINGDLYLRTLRALNYFEQYGYFLTDKTFDKYYSELNFIWCKISCIVFECIKYAHEIPPHYDWQEYFFHYQSRLDDIIDILREGQYVKMRLLEENLDLRQLLFQGVLTDENGYSWLFDFDNKFLESIQRSGALSKWVDFLCKRYDDEIANRVKNMSYDEMLQFRKDNYGNVFWVDIAMKAYAILGASLR